LKTLSLSAPVLPLTRTLHQTPLLALNLLSPNSSPSHEPLNRTLDQERILQEVDDRIHLSIPYRPKGIRLLTPAQKGANQWRSEQRRETLAAQSLEAHLRQMEEAQARQELLIARVKDREAVKQKELEERLRLEAQRRTP
jgi:hypothetical protein